MVPLRFLGFFKLLDLFTNDEHHKISPKISCLKLRKEHSPKPIKFTLMKKRLDGNI